jgi:hypothetical protein
VRAENSVESFVYLGRGISPLHLLKACIRIYKTIIPGQVLLSVSDGYRWVGWMSDICCIGYRSLISAIDRARSIQCDTSYKTTPTEHNR